MTTTPTIITQLRTLVSLTQTEAQVAEIRVAQARTEAVRRELRQNAANAEERTRLLLDALREAGGVPDVVTPVLGRVAAAVKASVEQVEPFDEALFGDLALEHQLVDRARYLKALAVHANDRAVESVADRLIEAHTATVAWLTTVLAEEALGGPAALRATPLQRVTGGAARALNLPGRVALDRVNAAVANVQDSGNQTGDKVSAVAGKATDISRVVRSVVAVGVSASLQRAEKIARNRPGRPFGSDVRRVRSDLGMLTADELPIQGYDDLKAGEAAEAVKGLSSPADIRAVVRYEEAHKDRSSVVSAAQARLATVAQETVGIA